ncbi:MAG: carbohydrate kinase family protein, partial [Candidatus Cloacimonadota bacterium]
TSGITETSQGTNTNILRYINDNERRETTEYFTDEIPYNKIKSFLSCDILLFNFIAGYDVSIKTLKKIRSHTQATIFLDVHSMVLKKKNAERAYSTVNDWEAWIQFVDIIQMNIQELYYFTGRMFSKEKPDEAILFLLQKGLKMVLITSGGSGVYLGYKGVVFFFNQKYSSVVKDTTGCGDIFSSSFLIRYLYTKDPFISCDYANCVSGMATVETGIEKCFLSNKAFPALPKFYSRSGNWGSP